MTVICDLSPPVTALNALDPVLHNNLGGLGDKGKPVSSILKIWQGLSVRLFSSRDSSSISKYASMTLALVPCCLAVDKEEGTLSENPLLR